MGNRVKIDRDIQVEKEIEALLSILKEKKLKITTQRLLVAETLFRIHSHFTAEDIIDYFQKENQNVSKATVYRILSILVDSGLIIEHHFGKGYKFYEHSYGHKHHDHFICENCGAILEFCNKEMEEFQKKTAEQFNFKINRHSLNIYGICEKCQNSQANSAKHKTTLIKKA